MSCEVNIACDREPRTPVIRNSLNRCSRRPHELPITGSPDAASGHHSPIHLVESCYNLPFTTTVDKPLRGHSFTIAAAITCSTLITRVSLLEPIAISWGPNILSSRRTLATRQRAILERLRYIEYLQDQANEPPRWSSTLISEAPSAKLLLSSHPPICHPHLHIHCPHYRTRYGRTLGVCLPWGYAHQDEPPSRLQPRDAPLASDGIMDKHTLSSMNICSLVTLPPIIWSHCMEHLLVLAPPLCSHHPKLLQACLSELDTSSHRLSNMSSTFQPMQLHGARHHVQLWSMSPSRHG